MTYIEFFDENASENISACLACVPDRVIYIGNNSKLMKRHIENYKKVFSQRGESIEFLYKTVSRNNMDNVVEMFCELTDVYDDCIFDITGGDEMYILALGMFCARFPDKNIQIQKFNPNNNAVYDCDKDGVLAYKNAPALSVIENIRIYGGDVVYGDISEAKTYEWDLNDEFISDVNIMWKACRACGRYWNNIIGIFEFIEKTGESVFSENLATTVLKSELKAQLERRKIKHETLSEFAAFLLKNNLLKAFDDSKEILTLAYKNEQVKKCLTKAGQVLEMKIYITAKNMLETDGTHVYNDAVNGAVIDWDGKLSDEAYDNYDTENEIDILLMHDTIPVFVSCKNGMVTAEELYKLNTVAQRFGGADAKKILIATAVSELGKAGNYLRQRAEDMNIKVLEDIWNLEDKELERKLNNLWRS